jgi:hypothetical protein
MATSWYRNHKTKIVWHLQNERGRRQAITFTPQATATASTASKLIELLEDHRPS